MEDDPGELMTSFTAIELDENTAPAIEALRGEGAGENIPAGLSVSSRNPSALRLYERLGFVRRSEKAKFAATRDSIIVLLRNS